MTGKGSFVKPGNIFYIKKKTYSTPRKCNKNPTQFVGIEQRPVNIDLLVINLLTTKLFTINMIVPIVINICVLEFLSVNGNSTLI